MSKKLVIGAVLASVVVILLATLLLPAISTSPSGKDWMYDDYRPVSDYGSDDVTGVFEIVTISGTDYIHASDVGSGTIGGREYSVSKADLDLILIWGQSNAAYWTANVSEAINPGLNAGYYFGTDDQLGSAPGDGEIDPATCSFESITDENGDLRIGDMGPAIAKTYHERTGHKVYLVNAAIGNKWITLFIPPEQMWTYCDNTVTAAISAVDTSKFDLRIVGYVWSQGEANASNSVDDYMTWFMMSFNSMSSGLLNGYVFDKVFIIETRPANGGNATIAQNELAEEYSNVYMASRLPETFTVENDLMAPDNLHYSQLGKNLIGLQVGEVIGKEVEPPSTPDFSPILFVIPAIIIVAMVVCIIQIVKSRDY